MQDHEVRNGAAEGGAAGGGGRHGGREDVLDLEAKLARGLIAAVQRCCFSAARRALHRLACGALELLYICSVLRGVEAYCRSVCAVRRVKGVRVRERGDRR